MLVRMPEHRLIFPISKNSSPDAHGSPDVETSFDPRGSREDMISASFGSERVSAFASSQG